VEKKKTVFQHECAPPSASRNTENHINACCWVHGPSIYKTQRGNSVTRDQLKGRRDIDDRVNRFTTSYSSLTRMTSD